MLKRMQCMLHVVCYKKMNAANEDADQIQKLNFRLGVIQTTNSCTLALRVF